MSTTTTAPGSAQAVRLVAEREISTKLRDKAFLASLAFTLLIIIGSIGVQALIAGGGPDRYDVGVVDEGGARVVAAADATARATADEGEDPEAELRSTRYEDAPAAEAAVRDGDADLALVPTSVAEGTTYELVGDESVPSTAASLLRQAAAAEQLERGLAGLGATPQERAALVAAPPLAERLLDPGDDTAQATVVGIVFAVLLFYAVFLFGMGIAQSVTEEKQSRVVELLVAAVPMRSLLAGKVLGNTVLAVGQLVLLVGVGLLAASIAGQGELVSLVAGASPWFLVFFLLGFLMLACVWAAAGALASRQEDLQSTTLPLQALTLVPFFVSVYVTSPGPVLIVASYVPFSAPFVMPRRLLLGDAAWWEGLLSAGLVALTAALLIGLAARLYQGSLLRTSTRTSWRAAWESSRQT